MKQRQPKKIEENLYYILDSLYVRNPKLLWNVFLSLEQAQDVIFKYLGSQTDRFFPILGKEAIQHGLTKFIGIPKRRRLHENFAQVRILKYDYPPPRISRQKRKSFRTNTRRRLRKLQTIKQKSL